MTKMCISDILLLLIATFPVAVLHFPVAVLHYALEMFVGFWKKGDSLSGSSRNVIWKMMTQTSWMGRKSYIEVLGQIKEESKFISNLKEEGKAFRLFDYHNNFMANMLEGKLLGKKRRGQ